MDAGFLATALLPVTLIAAPISAAGALALLAISLGLIARRSLERAQIRAG
jgi:hypothetical protein